MSDGRNKICVLPSIVMPLSVGVWTCGWKEIWSVLKKYWEKSQMTEKECLTITNENSGKIR